MKKKTILTVIIAIIIIFGVNLKPVYSHLCGQPCDNGVCDHGCDCTPNAPDYEGCKNFGRRRWRRWRRR